MRLFQGLGFVRMLSSAVLGQALLSAGNFLVGLALIRHAPASQYGYYVLITTTLLLLVALQGAYLQPSLIDCLTSQDREARRDFVGGLYREQGWRLLQAAGACVVGIGGLWYAGVLSGEQALIVLMATAAALATLYREFFRMVLLAYRLPAQALRVDIFYVILLCGGAYLASYSASAAVAAAFSLALAALTGGWLLSHRVRLHEGWNIRGEHGVLRRIAPVGGWAVAGAAIHWTFAQGYLYLVASTLDVTAVATLSATRLLLMPVNLMSSGIGSMTFPTVSRWLQDHSVPKVLARLALFSTGIACLALVYLVIMWLARDWIFEHVIHGTYAQRDTLLLLWSAVFLVMAVRDQMIFLPAARGRFRIMAWLTLATAVLSLVTSFVCMHAFGVVGALYGVLAGELFNVVGFVLLSLREVKIAREDSRLTPTAP